MSNDFYMSWETCPAFAAILSGVKQQISQAESKAAHALPNKLCIVKWRLRPCHRRVQNLEEENDDGLFRTAGL